MSELHDIFKALGEMAAKQDAMAEDIVEIKVGMEDYKRLKNRIVGVCIGISAIVGGTFSTILKKLGFDA